MFHSKIFSNSGRNKAGKLPPNFCEAHGTRLQGQGARVETSEGRTGSQRSGPAWSAGFANLTYRMQWKNDRPWAKLLTKPVFELFCILWVPNALHVTCPMACITPAKKSSGNMEVFFSGYNHNDASKKWNAASLSGKPIKMHRQSPGQKIVMLAPCHTTVTAESRTDHLKLSELAGGTDIVKVAPISVEVGRKRC